MAPRRNSANFEASHYSHLREFLRAYLHEDWPDEYGSVSEAVEQFWQDTGTASIAHVAEEWNRLQKTAGHKISATVDMLSRLGGAWNPTSQKDLDEIGMALAKHSGRGGRK